MLFSAYLLFLGESGIGKTQLCFQLCLNVQIPIQLGGVDGEAVYLDTENTFQTSRLNEIAEALIHVQQCELYFFNIVKKHIMPLP